MRKAICAVGETEGLRGLDVIAHSRGTDVVASVFQQLGVEAYFRRSSITDTLRIRNTALGGVDGLVFSAGIGERDALTRAEVVEGSRWTGAILDPARNEHNREGLISADNSSVAVWVIPTDEERLIARRTAAMLQ